VIWIQAAWLVADHVHSRSALMLSRAVPPDASKLDAELVIVIWQRAAVGAVTLVTAELPHAQAKSEATTALNSRALECRTSIRNTSAGPATITRAMRTVIVLALAASVGCVGNRAPTSAALEPTCAASNGAGVHWARTAPAREIESLNRWCAGVGPPSRVAAGSSQADPTGPLAIVSWNTHVGGGDLDAFVDALRSSRLTGGTPVANFVLLLQEAYRADGPVPAELPRGARWASAEQRSTRNGKARDEILAAARRLHLNVVYVPSMRNGPPVTAREDRGNAIVSTLPLTDVTAVELPLERQRRVAIEATVTLRPARGAAVALRLVTVHLTNMVMHHLWVFSEPGRDRQARALARVLPHDGPLVIGGDFNTWFGVRDAAYRDLARGMRRADVNDPRPTFGPMRLDHLLFRLPQGWRTTVRRASSRYGSDHYPLVAIVDGPRPIH
jgi:endonuclease/exonuclease/phosphatase family metal-dependent hydrolase